MTDSLWRTDQSSLVYAVDDGHHGVQSRDEVGQAPPREKPATLQPSLVELIAELHANSLSDSPALAAQAVDFADSDSTTDHPSSRARNSPGEASYFSFKRWYGALGQPGSGTDGQSEIVHSSDEVTQQFRRAIRRARETDGTASTASSCSSESYDTCVDSPASSTTTWATSASASGAHKDAGGGSGSTPSGDDAGDSPPPLRAAQSVATLRAPRILRKSTSSASLTSTSVQVPPRSPYTPPSPTFTTTASPVLDQYPWLSEPPSPSSTFAPPADRTPSTFGSRLASSLRKSASSFTLRLSARKFEAPPMPSPPSLDANGISVMSSNDPTKSSSIAGTAADRLRDLLLQHDAVVDPSIDPITPLFDPKLARSQGYRSDSDDSSSEDGEERASEAEAQEAFEVEQLLRGVSPAAAPPRSAFDPNSSEEDDDDDPFAANVRSEIAWMAPTTPERSPDAAPLFFEDEPASDSPSGAFPPFDPYGFTYARPPMPSLPPISPPRPSRTKVITKKRSFVDPSTRRIRTAPTVTVTPSTPERQRTRY